MPPKKREPLTPAEWKIMKIVWEKKTTQARDVCEEAEIRHDWSQSTVKTFLRRLVEKGYLSTTPHKNSFIYKPTQTALKSLCRSADHLLDNAMEGTVGPLLAYMVKKGKLEQDEIDELRRLLDACEDE